MYLLETTGVSIDMWEIIAAVVAAVWGIVKVYLVKKNKKLEKITQALEMSVNELYITARDMKAENEQDGGVRKLSKAQIKRLQEAAIAKANCLLHNEGIDLFNEISKDYLPVLVDKTIGRMKSGK